MAEARVGSARRRTGGIEDGLPATELEGIDGVDKEPGVDAAGESK